jgi:hypothetical protein
VHKIYQHFPQYTQTEYADIPSGSPVVVACFGFETFFDATMVPVFLPLNLFIV